MRTIALVVLVLTSRLVRCQTSDAALMSFQGTVAGHKFVLQDFSAQSEMKYHWRGSLLEADVSPLFKSVALFEVQDSKIKGQILVILGRESVVVEEQDTNRLSMSSETWPATIKVDLGSYDPTVVLPELTKHLFFTNVASALNAIPEYLKPQVPFRIVSKGDKTPCTTCKHWIRNGTWQELPSNDPDLKAPILRRGADPQLPLNVEIKPVNATTRFDFVVDEKGHPTEIWLTIAAGNGLDELYAYALRKQLFQPATHRGTPVAMTLGQEFHFLKP